MDREEENAMNVQEQAERWFARLLSADCSVGERDAFEQWRQAPEHALAYSRCQGLWDRFGAADVAADPRVLAIRERLRERAVPPTTVESDWQHALATLPARDRSERVRRRRLVWPMAIAASVMLLAVALGVRFMTAPGPETVYAAADTRRELLLEDGTSVQLDVGSELKVRFDGVARAMTLRRGRALFDVAHDAGRPFTVDLGDSKLTVLGTRFQTVRDAGNVSVTLERGSLRLDGRERAVGRSERLVPGDEVGYSVSDASSWHKRSVDSAAALAWSRGRLVFRATPLAEAVKEVNRYATPKLRLADPALGSLPVSGNFIAGDSDLVASTWAATLPVRVEKNAGEIVLQPAHR